MPRNERPHLVNIGEVKNMTVDELLQRIADHEKQYIDELKTDAFKREEERQSDRAKQSGKAPKKRFPAFQCARVVMKA